MPRYIEIPILIVLIIITGYFYIKERKKSYNAAKKLDEEIKKQKEQEVSKMFLTVKIDGMMCEKCASRVTQALSKYGNITVDLKSKNAVIESNELPDTEGIKDVINGLGYEFKGIE